jgi:hypothetical protein
LYIIEVLTVVVNRDCHFCLATDEAIKFPPMTSLLNTLRHIFDQLGDS